MRDSYEKVFAMLADHKPKRLRDLYGCVDWVDNDNAMQQRTRKLVDRVQQELDDKNSHWAITITPENGLAMYRLVKRQ